MNENRYFRLTPTQLGLGFIALIIAAAVVALLYFGGIGAGQDDPADEPTPTPTPVMATEEPTVAPEPTGESPPEEPPLEELMPVSDLMDECVALAGQQGEFSAECQVIHDGITYRCDIQSGTTGLLTGFCWTVESTETFCNVTVDGLTTECGSG